MNVDADRSNGLITFTSDSKQFQILMSRRGSCLLVQHFNGSSADDKTIGQVDRFYIPNIEDFMENFVRCYNIAVQDGLFKNKEE